MHPKWSYRRLVPLPADVPEERRVFMRRTERAVWVTMILVQLAIFGGHLLIDLLSTSRRLAMVWDALAAAIPAGVATVIILRYTFSRAAAEARQQAHQEAAQRERARMEGALLVARTAVHQLSNSLAPVSGFAELLLLEPSIQRDSRLSTYARLIHDGVQETASTLVQLQRIVRLQEDTALPSGSTSVLDLARSTAAAPAPLQPRRTPELAEC